MRIPRPDVLGEYAREALWVLPTVATVGAVALSVALARVEPAFTVFDGGADGARQILSTVAVAVITVTATVFSASTGQTHPSVVPRTTCSPSRPAAGADRLHAALPDGDRGRLGPGGPTRAAVEPTGPTVLVAPRQRPGPTAIERQADLVIDDGAPTRRRRCRPDRGPPRQRRLRREAAGPGVGRGAVSAVSAPP